MRLSDWVDIAKVHIAAWGTIGVTQAGLIRLAETVQAVGNALLVLAALGYTLWKWWKSIQDDEFRRKNESGPWA